MNSACSTTSDCPQLLQPSLVAPSFFSFSVYRNMFIESLLGDENLRLVCSRLPRSEIASFRRLRSDIWQNDEEMRKFIVINRLLHPICNRCTDRAKHYDLQLCGACQMTFYCSVKCQQDDWHDVHRHWCCIGGAEADAGPMGTQTSIERIEKLRSEFANAIAKRGKMK